MHELPAGRAVATGDPVPTGDQVRALEAPDGLRLRLTQN